MANSLKQLVAGTLDVELIRKHLTGEQLLNDNNGGPQHANLKTSEFVAYFLNHIREESSHHFTSDLPVISPKKIKKKKFRQPKYRTPPSVDSNNSTKSSARGSLFSTPPSGKRSNITLSPVEGRQTRGTKGTQNKSSPLTNWNSSGNEKSKVSHVTSTPVKFDLDEDFPSIGSQNLSVRKNSTPSQRITPTRRITPTPAHARRDSSNLFNSFTFDNSFGSEHSLSTEKLKQGYKHDSGSASPKHTRKAKVKLKLEDFMQQESRNRMPACHNGEVNSLSCSQYNSKDELRDSRDMERNSSHADTSNDLNSSTEDSVLAKREFVTECDVLERLAEVHSFCILENLVPNIVVEMCFILQLLTVKGENVQENDHITSGYLKSIHNCVFYAVHVLENLLGIIKLLDKGTLRLLMDNTRITEFSRNLNEELKILYPTVSMNKVPYSLLKSPLNSVPFQASIDNRNNFSSDLAFHCFKRQRDTFYEIVREWEEHCGKSGWSLEEKLGEKIRYVVNQKPGSSNHVHFARLFQTQLIQMCCYENTLPIFSEGASPEFVGNLFKSNPEKFFRLQQRLVAPQSTTAGPCPSPGFTETEEFFREFIVAAMSPSFNRYLIDSFIVKINELNNVVLDEELEDSTEDEMVKVDRSSKLQVKFASCLITLRTLGKFLGFLVFSPYHNPSGLPTAVMETSIKARNQVSQQIDLMCYLKKARDEQRLVMTLPWVIEYLSMMDNVSPFLDYYSQVFDFLHHIYRNMLSQNSSLNMNRNSLMLSVALGWLFEIPVIPDTMFTKSFEKISCDTEFINSTSALDKMNLVDQHLLYTCCPYLGELRSILAQAVVGKANKRGYMKKIKPICADDVEVSPSSRPVLQTKLEDNFFRNQPEFLKKDADFVAKRLYQNMVNMIKNDVIPSEIEQARQNLVTEATFNVSNWQEVNKEEFKEKHKILVMKLCNKTAAGVLEKISSEVNEMCKSRCLVAVQSLSPHGMNEIVIKTASGIVHQSTMNKLKEWSHQNISLIIEKLIRKDMDRMIAREQSIPENIYRARAQDCGHPFNWFYQRLLDKGCDE